MRASAWLPQGLVGVARLAALAPLKMHFTRGEFLEEGMQYAEGGELCASGVATALKSKSTTQDAGLTTSCPECSRLAADG